MLTNYIKITFRNIRRNFSYSLINVLGLAVGFATTLLIGLWVFQESGYDRHFDDSERIYRIGVNFMNIGDMAVSPVQLANHMRDYAEVEETGRLSLQAVINFYIGDTEFNESRVYYADSTFFDVFSYTFEEGSAVSALDHPNSMVVSRSTADKWFGDGDAMGKTVELGSNRIPYTITGVVENPVHKSHIEADIWMSGPFTPQSNWYSANTYTYVKLKPGFNKSTLEDRLEDLKRSVIYPSLSVSAPYEEWAEAEGTYRFTAFPIQDIYLKSTLKFEPMAAGNENTVKIFATIAILVLVIASINFVNLTTARSSIRAKEVGIRKTLGTSRGSMIAQFLFESAMLSLIAFGISLALAELFLTLFESYTGFELLDSLFLSGTQFLTVLCIVILIGMAAGTYPALYLSSFLPVKVLKGDIFSPVREKGFLRNGLVVVQFTISISLIISTIVITNQLQFMRTTDLGFNNEQLWVINNTGQLGDQKEVFRQRLLDLPNVQAASYNLRIPGGNSEWVTTVATEQMEQGYPMHSFHGDSEMIETLGFRIAEGRAFNRDRMDGKSIMLNRKAVQVLELENPLGAIINDSLTVIGIVEDFNFASLKHQIEPVVITLNPEGNRLAVRFSGNPGTLIEQASVIWAEMGAAGEIFDYIVDEQFEAMIQEEDLLARALLMFAVLAIFVSCLGLYGLSSFITERKTREIGVRRVMGAGVRDILLLLNRNFTRIVLISILISIPLAWYIMSQWLTNFAYKTEINLWVFIAAGGIALIISWVTVSGQSYRTAMLNPVESLRNE